MERVSVRLVTPPSRVRHDPAALPLKRAASSEPLRESAHRLMARVHLRQGNIADAIRQYQTYAMLLNRELDGTPSSGFPTCWRRSITVWAWRQTPLRMPETTAPRTPLHDERCRGTANTGATPQPLRGHPAAALRCLAPKNGKVTLPWLAVRITRGQLSSPGRCEDVSLIGVTLNLECLAPEAGMLRGISSR